MNFKYFFISLILILLVPYISFSQEYEIHQNTLGTLPFSGQWRIHEHHTSNKASIIITKPDFFGMLNLHQTQSGRLTGTIKWDMKKQIAGRGKGIIDGQILGNNVEFTISYPSGGEKLYKGTLNHYGTKIKGTSKVANSGYSSTWDASPDNHSEIAQNRVDVFSLSGLWQIEQETAKGKLNIHQIQSGQFTGTIKWDPFEHGEVGFQFTKIHGEILGHKVEFTTNYKEGWHNPVYIGTLSHDGTKLNGTVTMPGFSYNWNASFKQKEDIKEEKKQTETICASAKPSITSGSEFKRAKFTIGGEEPQRIKITSSADNFAIKKEFGGLVYQVIDGTSWGNLTLDPGSYILSCNGGGAMGLMSASVCIKNPMAGQAPLLNEQTNPISDDSTTLPEIESDENQTVEVIKPSLPRGPVERIVIRAQGDPNDELFIKKGEIKQIVIVHGLDAVGNKIGGVIADEWKISTQSDKSVGSINSRTGEFKAGQKEGKIKVIASIKNKNDKLITGTFSILVSEDQPYIVKGKVKLYDENNRLLKNLGGVLVHGRITFWENIDAFNKYPNRSKEYPIRTRTKSDGKFKFKVPAKYKGYNYPGGWYIETSAPASKLHPRHAWTGRDPIKDSRMNRGSGPGPLTNLVSKGNNVIRIGPNGAGPNSGSYTEWMKKADFVIDGKVVHHGKLVEYAIVSLVDYKGDILNYGYSNKNGYYKLPINGKTNGRYWLKVEGKPNEVKTVHNLLYMKEKKSVDLPLITLKKTINIEMISFKDKIGYKGP